jgi:tRNA U55 pseudouridine synthase TruB
MYLENNGYNQNGFPEFSLTVDSMSMYTNNGSIDISSGNYIKQLVNGYNTQYQYLDNIYKLTGNAQGNSSNNNNFNLEISNSLSMNLSCFESSSCIITGGTSILIPDGYEERIINYGDNSCDCDINAIIGENTHPIIVN